MFIEAPQTLMYIAAGAFLLGWLVGKIGAYFGNKFAARKRDPRDDRIRSLTAEVRVAQTDAEKAKEELSKRNEEGTALNERIAERETAVDALQATVSQLRKDLKESVKKTRELRAELSDRATENVRSEVLLREVQTELSVAQASTDLIATGVLDYSVAPDGENDADESTDNTMPAKSAW
jgi:predicted transcriptional regulator